MNQCVNRKSFCVCTGVLGEEKIIYIRSMFLPPTPYRYYGSGLQKRPENSCIETARRIRALNLLSLVAIYDAYGVASYEGRGPRLEAKAFPKDSGQTPLEGDES